ncbi:hypothetical protein GCM10018966_005330 [Streptomyces yanii]
MKPVAGEQADQVVEAITARGTVGKEAEIDEVVERRPRVLARHPADDGRQSRVEVLARHHSEPPEHSPRGIGEVFVRHPERVGDLEVAGRELLQPALLIRQPGSQFSRAPSGPADQPVPDDPQSQRQTTTQLSKASERRLAIRCGAFTQNPGQQCPGLRQRQRPQDEPAYPLQPGQQPPGGDQHPARAAARQQRAHLLLRPSVVEDDQYTLVPQQGPIQGGTVLGAGRDLLVRGPERTQQQM